MSSLRTMLLLVTASAITHLGTMKAQTTSWILANLPSARCCSGFAYDGATQSTVLFGGAAGSSIYGDTWTWRGGWFQMSPATSPSRRNGPGMAFDGAAGNIVLFGGSTTAPLGTGSSLGDTWTWDGTTWTQQFPPVSPPARTWTSMAYVPATKTVVLFGGNNLAGGDGPFSDTWTWDGTAKTWTQQNPANHPSARGSIQLVYDQATSTVVLFGGVTTDFTNLNDTWTWNGTNWTQQFPSSSPSPRNTPALACDPGLGAVVLFSGAVGSNNLNDTWTWNGANWMEIYPANTLPRGRNSAGMAYDPTKRCYCSVDRPPSRLATLGS